MGLGLPVCMDHRRVMLHDPDGNPWWRCPVPGCDRTGQSPDRVSFLLCRPLEELADDPLVKSMKEKGVLR